MPPTMPVLATLLLLSPSVAALAPAGTTAKVNVPAVITIVGVMGGGPYQVVPPPLATCSTSVSTPTPTSHDVDVVCTFPSPINCGDAAVVQATAASTNGRVSAYAQCGGTVFAWCSTEPTPDPFFPWDYSQCRAHNPGYIDVLEGDFDPIGNYGATIRCSAVDGAATPGVRPLGAYAVECVFPL